MSITIVQAALDAHLQTLVGLPTLQLENTRNVGVTGQTFSRATLLPARTSQVSVGVNGRNQLSGLYQIDLFVPQDTGVSQASALADLVLQHFPRGLVLTSGSVTTHVQMSWREAGARHEPFYQCPVVVSWSAIV